MNLAISVDQKQLMNVLLNVGTVRPVFIWGAPGIGKSAIVEQFASDVGLECVSLLGSQLAPEDIIGVPQIVDGRSVFCPPRMIAREEPYYPLSGAVHKSIFPFPSVHLNFPLHYFIRGHLLFDIELTHLCFF